VSFGPAFDAKEQVRQAIDIVDLVGSYVQLRRQGQNFVGLCPWHDDSRPSLHVNQQRQSWKCWVCDIGGDVFSFIMKAEGLEFREALELLAERTGIQIQHPPRKGREPGVAATPGEVDKQALRRVMAWAREQYHRCLVAAPEGEPGRQYLAERGISPQVVRRFQVGYAPDRWDWLVQRMRGTEWTPALLECAGLLRRQELGGGHYDWFRGRVMFPISDSHGRPIGFGGRVLPQLAGERAAKYINSPETPLFSKSRELYGLDVARDRFKAAGGAIVVEGYTDVLMAHQHGIENCVAVLGTAFGERHLQLLRRFSDSITLVLDGDEAGRRRTNEILDNLLALFEKNQVDLRILTLPEGVDPCDFIGQHGSDPFRQLLTQAVDALEHKFRSVTEGLDTLTDTHRVSQAAEQMLVTLAQVRPNGGLASSQVLLREEQMLSRVARKLQLSEETLRSRLKTLRREARRRSGMVRAPAAEAEPDHADGGTAIRLANLPAWDRELLELLLLEPAFIPRVAVCLEPSTFLSEVARSIFAAYCRLAKDGWRGEFGWLLSTFDDPEMKNLLVELGESCETKAEADRERWLADLLETYRRRREESERRARLAAARQNADEAEELLARFCQQAKPKHLSEYERRKQ